MNLMTVQVLGQAHCFGVEATWGSRGFAGRDNCQKLYNIINDKVSLNKTEGCRRVYTLLYSQFDF